MTENRERSSFLVASPKTFRYWWTFVPVLPADREDHAYKVLKRQWADHTMNTLRQTSTGVQPGSRGFYVETREDHIATCLFHIWHAFPDVSWVSDLLHLWNVPHGHVRDVRWSYSWEEPREARGGRDITDIVLCWRDEQGPAAIVIEAKRPGGLLSDKDRGGALQYLEMPSLRNIDRRRVVFLVDERDREKVIRLLPTGTAISTWQDMGRAQVIFADRLPIPQDTRDRVKALIARHYDDLGGGFDKPLASVTRSDRFTGKESRYDAVRALCLPGSIERFLIGSEVTFCARSGVMPEAPMPWLKDEPSLLDVIAAKAQSTWERELPLWRL